MSKPALPYVLFENYQADTIQCVRVVMEPSKEDNQANV